MTSLHEQLVDRQATPELKRKKVKAERRGIWTQEDIDHAGRSARELIAWIKWGTDKEG